MCFLRIETDNGTLARSDQQRLTISVLIAVISRNCWEWIASLISRNCRRVGLHSAFVHLQYVALPSRVESPPTLLGRLDDIVKNSPRYPSHRPVHFAWESAKCSGLLNKLERQRIVQSTPILMLERFWRTLHKAWKALIKQFTERQHRACSISVHSKVNRTSVFFQTH